MAKRTPAQIEWNRKQAFWVKNIKNTHSLFCNCGDWWAHLNYMRKCDPITTEGNHTKEIKKHIQDTIIIAGGGEGMEDIDILDK